jgi:hypothetical protein
MYIIRHILFFFFYSWLAIFMEVTGLKRHPILKMGQKASHSKFVGTMGHNDKKRDNPVLNGTYGHSKI